MAKDDREEERAFLEGLKTRTGRDLAEWMAAIAAQGFSDKNEIIDWLRTQGLPFARASWLERIHRNGGRPIHADAPADDARRAGARQAPQLRLVPKAAEEVAREAPEKRRRASRRQMRPRPRSSRSGWRQPRATARSIVCWRPRSARPSPASRSRRRPGTYPWARRASSRPSPCTRPRCGSASI